MYVACIINAIAMYTYKATIANHIILLTSLLHTFDPQWTILVAFVAFLSLPSDCADGLFAPSYSSFRVSELPR